jgi:hypothetical protein
MQVAAFVKKAWSSRQLPTVSFWAAGAVYASGASRPVPHSPSNNIADSSSPVTASVPTSLSRAWIFVFLAQRTSTTTSGQRPDNCGNANRSIKPLATHGRAIHLGHWRRLPCVHAPSGYAPKLTRSAVFLTANLASTRRRPRARALVPSQPGARCRCRARRRANHRQLR